MENESNMNISTLMMAMLVMIGIILGCVSYYGDIINTYTPVNSSDMESLNALNQTFLNYSIMMENLENINLIWKII
jgi:hypothetical protein